MIRVRKVNGGGRRESGSKNCIARYKRAYLNKSMSGYAKHIQTVIARYKSAYLKIYTNFYGKSIEITNCANLKKSFNVLHKTFVVKVNMNKLIKMRLAKIPHLQTCLTSTVCQECHTLFCR